MYITCYDGEKYLEMIPVVSVGDPKQEQQNQGLIDPSQQRVIHVHVTRSEMLTLTFLDLDLDINFLSCGGFTLLGSNRPG